jgi:hypothetical protein
MQITNINDISLPLAVWLASDSYDFTPNEFSISATSLLRPLRQTLLERRLTTETKEVPDVTDFIASRMGHSLHDGIERAWRGDYKDALRRLGYPEKLVESVRINPTNIQEGEIPIYLEQRSTTSFMGYVISGKFDMILDGELNDFKSTSVYGYINGTNDEKYIQQGSIYRWLNPTKVTKDYMHIQFIFTDWSRAQSRANQNYPKQRILTKAYPLMSVQETEAWIIERLAQIDKFKKTPQRDLPRCSDKDLWRGNTVYKYFSDPTKTSGRSAKNFTDKLKANLYLQQKGKGIIIEVPGQVKACGYCPAFPICTQKDEYIHE